MGEKTLKGVEAQEKEEETVIFFYLPCTFIAKRVRLNLQTVLVLVPSDINQMQLNMIFKN